MRYLIEGFAREVGAIGELGHVCFFVEAANADAAIAEAYKTHEHFSRVPGWNGPLIHVAECAPLDDLRANGV